MVKNKKAIITNRSVPFSHKCKKGIGPVVATALLIVVSVVAVIGFQNWFGMFSSDVFVQTEIKSSTSSSTDSIETIIGDQLYVKGSIKNNLSIKKITVDGNDCNIGLNITGVQNISLGNCLNNLTTNSPEVVIVTQDKVISKKIYLSESKILINTPVVALFGTGNVSSYQKISDTQGNFTGNLVDWNQFGNAVSSIGDLDDDGIEDLAVGLPYDGADFCKKGAVFILFLNSDGTVRAHQKINNSEGNFNPTLEDWSYFGNAIDLIGDLDNDGIEDLIVGSYRVDASYVLLMEKNGSVKSYQRIDSSNGNLSISLSNVDFGMDVAGIGDLDGDGFEDVVIGSPTDDDGGTSRGAIYILFLNSNGTVRTHQKISDTQGNFEAILENSDGFGGAISSIGDLNNDGVVDLVVGAGGDDDGGSAKGAFYILFMNSNGTVKSYQKISETQGNLGLTLVAYKEFGRSVSSIGDLNNDNIEDIAVGIEADDGAGSARGAIHILFLNSDGTVNSSQKINDVEGNFGAVLEDGVYFGTDISYFNDLNGDGVEDIVVGSYADNDGGGGRGAAYILFMEGK